MTGSVLLRDVTEDDLPTFFTHQLDPDATYMAGFPSRDRDAFIAQVTTHPLFAYVVKHNAGSRRVLEKCGFQTIGEEGQALILKLDV